MGQKINPTGFRLTTKKNCSSWFTIFKNYSYLLKQDNHLLSLFKQKSEEFGINKIRIKRNTQSSAVTIHVHTVYPHLVLNKFYQKFIRVTNQKILFKIFQIETLINKINLLATFISEQIRARIAFQRIIQILLSKIENTSFQGIKIQIAGRLSGIEKAKTEWYRNGKIPLNTLTAKIDYTQKTIATKYGSIGLKLWLINSEC